MPSSEYIFQVTEPEKKEALIAVLQHIGFEGFEEDDDVLKAYCQGELSPRQLETELSRFPILTEINFHHATIQDQNWNTLWESNYPPVVVKEQVAILSSFHEKIPGVKYEIIIDPKMSFGTGHHATTVMMIETMLEEDFENKTVLDFGSGTGILSILAAKMGAKKITAIDNEEWAFENMKENFKKNEVTEIFPILGDESKIPEGTFDFLLANVNKNIILKCIEILVERTANNGNILFSGIMAGDEAEIFNSVENLGLRLKSKKTEGEWICLKMGNTKTAS